MCLCLIEFDKYSLSRPTLDLLATTFEIQELCAIREHFFLPIDRAPLLRILSYCNFVKSLMTLIWTHWVQLREKKDGNKKQSMSKNVKMYDSWFQTARA